MSTSDLRALMRDPAGDSRRDFHPMSGAEKLVSAAGIAILAAILALVFNAYLAPGMLINFANLVLCG